MIKVFSTEKDHSLKLLVKELHNLEIEAKIIFYRDLDPHALEVNKEDKIILRDPYNTGLDYSQVLRSILHKYKNQVLLDSEYMLNYPDYEDKLSQLGVFSQLKLNYPKSVETFLGEPLIAKKRISSRNKGNFILRSHLEFTEFFKENNRDEYILQELINVKHDYRLLFYKKNFLGALERDVRLSKKSKNKFSVKAIDNKDQITENKLPLAECMRFIDATKADFIGIDVIQDNEQFYFIEANLSPQFQSFMKNTGVNVVRLLAEDLIRN